MALPTLLVNDLLLHHSSLERSLRVTSYVFHFIRNCRIPRFLRKKESPLVSVAERKHALCFWIKHVQRVEFPAEYDCLHRKVSIKKSSPLSSLNPFMDSSNVIRVGGRIDHSELSYEQKHTMILPKNHHLTELIIRQTYIQNLHSSLNVTMSILRQTYWIIHARNTIKRIIHQCVSCHRFRSIQSQQLMADLPSSHVTMSPPFTRCGIDYAGPFITRLPAGRTRTTYKSYLALFVCLTTKAVHFELVSDLTTPAFITALQRFVSRRGYPSTIMSDNGTNFVGAQNTLRAMHELLNRPESTAQMNSFCLPNSIN